MTTPRKIKTTALIAILVTTLISSAPIWAQPTPAQIHMQQQQQVQNLGGMIQSDNMRRCGNPNGCNQENADAAARRRAWEAREREVQAEIAELRATPWYMAIAYDFTNKRVAWAGGYATEQRAVEMATEGCRRRKANCQVALLFHNACAVMTSPYAGIKSVNDIFFGIHPDDKQAAEISIKKCEAVHGKDNCAYSATKTRNGTAFCTGYDYGFYGYK